MQKFCNKADLRMALHCQACMYKLPVCTYMFSHHDTWLWQVRTIVLREALELGGLNESGEGCLVLMAADLVKIYTCVWAYNHKCLEAANTAACNAAGIVGHGQV